MKKTENKIFKFIGIVLVAYMIVWFWPVLFGSNNNVYHDSYTTLINDNTYVDPSSFPPSPRGPTIIIQEPMADGYEDPVTDTPYDPSNPDPVAPPHSSDEPIAPDEQVACTMEAKQCPDGSYVGRQGPKCEFSPCPGN